VPRLAAAPAPVGTRGIVTLASGAPMGYALPMLRNVRWLLAVVVLVAAVLAARPTLAAPVGGSPLGDALDLLDTLETADGAAYPVVIRSLGVTFDFVPLPTIFYGAYQRRARRVLLNSRLLDEDATVLAAVIAHELQHASDYDLIAAGALQADCTDLEVRAFEAQSRVWRAFWSGELLADTRVQQDLTRIARRYEAEGVDGLRAMVAGASFYQRECAA